jgi:phosphoribosylanthranilate isomerase
MVGVFVNESTESLLRVTNEAGIDAVQLHGDESPEFCASVKALLNGRTVIKAVRVGAAFDPSDTTSYKVDAIMLDAFHDELRGGTGRVVDWDAAQITRDLVSRLFLSGGLSPENVAAAIAHVRPYAVDACSSLESSPGRKDASRMKAFVRAVRNG